MVQKSNHESWINPVNPERQATMELMILPWTITTDMRWIYKWEAAQKDWSEHLGEHAYSDSKIEGTALPWREHPQCSAKNYLIWFSLLIDVSLCQSIGCWIPLAHSFAIVTGNCNMWQARNAARFQVKLIFKYIFSTIINQIHNTYHMIDIIDMIYDW